MCVGCGAVNNAARDDLHHIEIVITDGMAIGDLAAKMGDAGLDQWTEFGRTNAKPVKGVLFQREPFAEVFEHFTGIVANHIEQETIGRVDQLHGGPTRL